jgi:hypothetical protein
MAWDSVSPSNVSSHDLVSRTRLSGRDISKASLRRRHSDYGQSPTGGVATLQALDISNALSRQCVRRPRTRFRMYSARGMFVGVGDFRAGPTCACAAAMS